MTSASTGCSLVSLFIQQVYVDVLLSPRTLAAVRQVWAGGLTFCSDRVDKGRLRTSAPCSGYFVPSYGQEEHWGSMNRAVAFSRHSL